MMGLGLLLLGVLLAPDRARAQQQDSPSYWKQHLDKQVDELVESSNPALRAEGMRLVISLASEDEATIDFSETRGALYDVFFNRTYSDEQRILALSALDAIGSDRMTQVLADWVDEASSDRIRRHVLLTLEQQS